MSDTSKENKKLKKKAVKSVIPPQSSPQDTSNWDDREVSVPQTKTRKRRDFVHSPPARWLGECKIITQEEYNQQSVEPNNKQEP